MEWVYFGIMKFHYTRFCHNGDRDLSDFCAFALGLPTFSGEERYSRPVTHFGQRNFQHCDAHFSNVGNCNLSGALYVHTDESDGYQKNFMPLAPCAREYFTRFSDFTAEASWLVVGPENSTRRSLGTVLSAKRPSRSLEEPFYTASYDQRWD